MYLEVMLSLLITHRKIMRITCIVLWCRLISMRIQQNEFVV